MSWWIIRSRECMLRVLQTERYCPVITVPNGFRTIAAQCYLAWQLVEPVPVLEHIWTILGPWSHGA